MIGVEMSLLTMFVSVLFMFATMMMIWVCFNCVCSVSRWCRLVILILFNCSIWLFMMLVVIVVSLVIGWSVVLADVMRMVSCLVGFDLVVWLMWLMMCVLL